MFTTTALWIGSVSSNPLLASGPDALHAAAGLEPAVSVPAAQSASLALPYSYLEARFVRLSVDGFGEDPEGIDLTLSKDLGDTWFFIGSITMLQGEVAGSDVDIDTLELGLGLHTSVAEQVDLVLSASWLHVDADITAPGPSNDRGYGLRGGLRFALGANAELGAGLFHTELDDAGSDTALYADAAYYFEGGLGLTLSFESTDDADAVGLGLRLVP